MASLQQDYAAVQANMQRGGLSVEQQEEESIMLRARQNELARQERGMTEQLQQERNAEIGPLTLTGVTLLP